jgi:hypothetical protein
MIIYFFNFQNKHDPNNGRAISSEDELNSFLDDARNATPSLVEFSGATDFNLMIGIGGYFSCAQYSRVDGLPPYLMAVSRHPPVRRGYIEFMCGGTPTPVGARNLLSFDEVKEIVRHYMRTGERSDAVSWRDVHPGDVKEDAERPPEP